MATQIITKRCTKCKQIKSLSEFYKRNDNKGGYRNDCKICRLKQAKEYRQTKKGKEKYHAYITIYRKSEKGKYSHRKGQIAYHLKYPEKYKAYHNVGYAIETGKLPSAQRNKCRYCPEQAEQYHHQDYSKPLVVIPVCQKCHKTIHKSWLYKTLPVHV